MPQGKGTYGSKVGRPPKKKGSLLNNDREGYAEGKGTEDMMDMIRRRGEYAPTLDSEFMGFPYSSKEKEKALEGVVYGASLLPFTVVSKLALAKKALQAYKKIKNVKKTKIKKLEDEYERLQDITLTATTVGAGTTVVLEDKIPEESLLKKELFKSKTSSKDKSRTKKAEGGTTEDQMNALAISVAPARVEEQETHTMPDGTEMAGATHEEYEQMLPDEEMEEDYVDYIVESTLSEEDQNYLESALVEDAKLSELFDQVVESASEFSGSGPVEGLGSGVSDSIPARLSDGEFVFTAKATDEIGADNLQRMMEDAEAGAEERQGVVHGGVIDEEERAVPIQTRGSVVAQGNIPNVAKQSRQVEEEMLKSSPRRYYVPVSG